VFFETQPTSLPLRGTKNTRRLVCRYKTISALAGIPKPEAGVDGTDLSAVFANPKHVLKNVTYVATLNQKFGVPLDQHDLCG
jgi:hypothetical protein